MITKGLNKNIYKGITGGDLLNILDSVDVLEEMKRFLSNLSIEEYDLTDQQIFSLFYKTRSIRKIYVFLIIVLFLLLFFITTVTLGQIFPLYTLNGDILNLISIFLLFIIGYLSNNLVKLGYRTYFNNKIKFFEIENLKIKVANLENKGVKNEK